MILSIFSSEIVHFNYFRLRIVTKNILFSFAKRLITFIFEQQSVFIDYLTLLQRKNSKLIQTILIYLCKIIHDNINY